MSNVSRPNRAEHILNHALRYSTPCRSPEGLPCALVPLSPFAHDLLPVRSVLFRDWLADTFHREHDLMPSLLQLRTALQLFEAKARRSELSQQSIALRVSHRSEPFDPVAILVDLCRSDGRAIEITAQGWQIISTDRRAFRRSRAQQPLPPPTEPATSLPSALHFPPAALAWLVSAFRPIGPYPILLLKGPAASGKTMLARMLRALIDSSASVFCPRPRTERDLMRLAWNNYVLAFDDCADLPTGVLAALRRLSSGAPFEFDQSAYSADSLSIRLQRPIILTASSDCASGNEASLANHAITIDLPPVIASQRRTEREILFEFECARPALLATACTAVTLALGDVSSINSEFPSRFADAFQWSLAAAPAFGIAASQMRMALCPDTLAREVAAFAREKHYWEGSPTELLAALQGAHIPNLPNSPRAPHPTSSPSAPIHSRRHVRSVSYWQPSQNPHDASLPFWRHNDPVRVSIFILLIKI
jgi:putative DNA primase/helicase